MARYANIAPLKVPMTTEPSLSPRYPNDKDTVIQLLNSLTVQESDLTKGVLSIIQETDVEKLSIFEINEILQAQGKLNKQLSKSLDYVSEYKMKLIQELRIKTRKQLNE